MDLLFVGELLTTTMSSFQSSKSDRISIDQSVLKLGTKQTTTPTAPSGGLFCPFDPKFTTFASPLRLALQVLG